MTANERARPKMPRDYFEYTREKLISFSGQISELLSSDFPIETSRAALIGVRELFSKELEELNGVSGESVEVRQSACAGANLKINKYLPLLGFILRSTNVRNAFEISDPLSRLANRLT